MISTPRSTASKKQQPGKGPVSTPKTEDKMIVRALRAEIAGPLEGSWSDLGPQLRAWASAVHHMANEGVLAAHVAARDPKKKVAPQTAAYRAAGQAQEDFKAWAKRKGGDAKEQQLRGELAFGGGVQAAIGAMSFTALKKWQKERGADRVIPQGITAAGAGAGNEDLRAFENRLRAGARAANRGSDRARHAHRRQDSAANSTPIDGIEGMALGDAARPCCRNAQAWRGENRLRRSGQA